LTCDISFISTRWPLIDHSCYRVNAHTRLIAYTATLYVLGGRGGGAEGDTVVKTFALVADCSIHIGARNYTK